jgi:hypothetical protein
VLADRQVEAHHPCAVARYGAYLGDTGADGYFGLEVEAGVQYMSFKKSDRWRQFGMKYWEPYAPNGSSPEYVGKLYNTGGETLDWDTEVWGHMRVLQPTPP